MTKLFKTHPSATIPLCLGLLLALTAQPRWLQAETVQTDEWQIEADKVLNFDNPKSVIAEGNVVLTKLRILPPKRENTATKSSDWSLLLEENATPTTDIVTQEITKNTTPRTITEVTIRADWIAYDVEHNSIKAKGNVSVSNDTDQLLAQEGVLDLDSETGTFKEATILRESLNLHLEGKTIEKTGINTYHIKDGWVVTCKVPEGNTPPWSFAASDAVIIQGEYATLKHATFRIKDVPVLYSPWLMLPIGNQRQSGILFPEISNSKRNGFGFNLPLFLNISDSSDLTIYSEYFANRGFMPSMEFRYTLDPQQKAAIMATYLSDSLSDPSEVDYYTETGYTHTNKDRYWVRGKLDHDFDNGLVSRVDLDIVSDRDYLVEFNSGITGFQQSNSKFLDVFGRSFQNRTSDQRENSLKLLKSWDGMAIEGVFLGINDVRQDKTSPTPLWKLPSLDFTGSRPLGESPITLDWDTDYVNYYRENGVGGHRFDIYPRLSAPLPLGPYLEARTEAGLRDTFYSVQTFGDGTWDQDDTPNRFLGDFHAEIGSTLLRDFPLDLGETTGFSHKLRPFVKYDYLSDTNQDNLPEFDSIDRIGETNAITYGIDNFFDLFGFSGGKSSSRDYGNIKFSQSYDLRSEMSDTPLTPINIKVRWFPLKTARVIYKTDLDVYGAGFTSHTLETSYNNSRGDYLNIDYRYADEGLVQQLNLRARAQLFDTVFASYNIEHSLSESRIIEQNISLRYQPACWSVELQSRYTPGDHTIMVLFNLANIGSPLGLRM